MIDHPLFPPTDDEPDPPDVERVHVTRFEPKGQMWCPRVFMAEELMGLEDVHALFGGGAYELIARSSKNKEKRNVISARRRYQIPGPSRPLVLDGSEPEAPAPVVASPSPGAGGVSLWPTLLALIPPLLQAWMGSQKEHTAMMMAMMNSQQQTMAALMNAGKTDAHTLMQMMAKMNESDKANMASFFGKLAEMKTGGGGDIEALMAGLELGSTLKSGGGGDDGGGLEQFAQLAQSLAMLKGSEPAAPSQPSAPPPPPPAKT